MICRLKLLYIFILLVLVSACGESAESDQGKAYQLDGKFDVDSTVVLDHLVLYSDCHTALKVDTMVLSEQNVFTHEGHSATLDELYLCSEGGELARFYAGGGMQVDFEVKGTSGDLKTVFSASPLDTINPWLQEQLSQLRSCTSAAQHTLIDSLCHQQPSDIRNALLLRQVIAELNDSIFIRRCLGALTETARPDWLMKSIDELMSATAPYLKQNRRLSSYNWALSDSLNFDMTASRSDYLVLYFWADYDKVSIDSLKAVGKLLAEEYDYKRLKLFSCCLHAPDSTWWQQQIADIDAMHTLVPAGLSDSRIRNWRIERVPMLIVTDMYGNQQQRDVWGRELRNALNRVPNRSGFAHTPKKTNHGR